MEEEVISLAKKLISFKTVTPNDDGITDFLINYLKENDFLCEKMVFSDVTNLFAKIGNSNPHFCFAAHTDVVPPGEGWSNDPFEAKEINGFLYGRGASDMKAALAAQLVAAKEFIKKYQFEGSISFIITGDEEAKAENGTIKILESLIDRKEKIDGCIVGEPTCSNKFGDIIKYGRRGSISFTLDVKGTQGHVAYPELANNPIYPLLNILQELKKTRLDEGNENFIASNLEITDIFVGNKASNLIPKNAKATFNIRYNDIHDFESLKKLVQEICFKYSNEFELISSPSAKAFVNNKNSDLVKNLSSAIVDIIGIEPNLSTTGGTSDARFISAFSPVIEFGLINQTAHHVDEHVSITDIVNLKNIYFQFLKKFFKVA